jgi:hypothetical protein
VFEQIQGHVPQRSKVFRTVILAHAARVFLKGDIENPMDAVFNLLMTTHGLAKGLGIA